MQNEEKNRLEERIIAHFDGSLSGEESNSLLREVSSNVEARALFKSYETLNRVISASRIPMELPVEARTSIAERIPGLLAFIPGLIGTVETLPVITQSANPFVAFFTKMSLSTAVSIGTSAVVLTTAGVIVKNKIDDNAAVEKAKVAAVQNHQRAGATSAPMYATLPGHDLTTPNFNAGERAGWSSEATTDVKNGTSGAASSTTHTSYRTDNQSAVPGADKNVAATSNDNAAEPPAPMATAASPLPVSPVAANIPDFHPTTLGSLPMLLAGELPIRPFVSMGTRVQFMSADQSISGLTQNSSGLGYDLRAGLDIGLTNELGLRIQGGQMQISHVVDRASWSSNDPFQQATTKQWIEYSTVSLANAYWTTLGVTYQVYATDAIPLTFSLNGGAAFLDKTSPMGEFGLSTEMAVSNHLLIRPALTFDAVWTDAENTRSNPKGDAILVDRSFPHSASMWSTSLGLNLGFQYHF